MRTTTQPCTLVRNNANLGLNRSLNRGMERAIGEFVVCLDADDSLLPHMVESHVRLLLESDDLVLVHGDGRRLDQDGAVLVESIIMEHRSTPAPTGMIFTDVLIDPRFIHFSTVTMRRSAMDTVGPFDEELAYQDFDMLLRPSIRALRSAASIFPDPRMLVEACVLLTRSALGRALHRGRGAVEAR